MLSLKTAETGNMKTQLLCLMLVVFVATVHGMLLDCATLKNCGQCPSPVVFCRNVTKCGCCDICLDELRFWEYCGKLFVWQTKCHRGFSCDPKSVTCQPHKGVPCGKKNSFLRNCKRGYYCDYLRWTCQPQKGTPCGKPFFWQRKCKRGLSCDRKSWKCLPQKSDIPKMFRKSFYAAMPAMLHTNPYIKCHQGLCYCIFEGKRLRDYHVFVRIYAGHFVCRCAAAKAENDRIGKVSKQCSIQRGDYEQIQCVGSKCYCALENGTTYGPPHPYDYFGKATNPCTMVG